MNNQLINQKNFMSDDFNCLTDYALADCEPLQEVIDLTFKTLPWMSRLFVNGQPLSRKDWREDLEKRKDIANKTEVIT